MLKKKWVFNFKAHSKLELMDLRNEGFNFYGMMSNACAENKRRETHLGDILGICRWIEK